MERLTIDEVILKEKRIYAENQKIVDTHVLCGEFTLEELYCDDTEVIEESLMHRKFDLEYHKQLTEWLEQLKAYKDAEEQGLLLRLPCRVGTTLYQPIIGSHVQEVIVIGLCFDIVRNVWLYEIAFEYNNGEWIKTVCEFSYIGVTVFLTREEAEQALKQMGE